LSQRSMRHFLYSNFSFSNCGSDALTAVLYSPEIHKDIAGQCCVSKRGVPTSRLRYT
jgi:hypothetical protein